MAIANSEAVYTIGHSTHHIKDFISLLKRYGITAVADVRSFPFSKHNPQFNKDALTDALKQEGISYVFLGMELGARPDDSTCYDNGSANFTKMAERPIFKQGIERLLNGMGKYRIAMLCAEKEPLDCHRTILVCRHLREFGLPIKHILADGGVEDHQATEHRLVKALGLEPILFDSMRTDADRIEEAYNQRAREIAYKREREEENREYAR
ncbi:MAG: DUF488 domain-containing protein [Deltaproteobacteria bacterium]|nr:DUF488 domain-containing protein [Deltaproteobacteria bacterium]